MVFPKKSNVRTDGTPCQGARWHTCTECIYRTADRTCGQQRSRINYHVKHLLAFLGLHILNEFDWNLQLCSSRSLDPWKKWTIHIGSYKIHWGFCGKTRWNSRFEILPVATGFWFWMNSHLAHDTCSLRLSVVATLQKKTWNEVVAWAQRDSDERMNMMEK